ncbi:MAG: NUDIX domain-containing protein [Minisyncoccia bacterium]
MERKILFIVNVEAAVYKDDKWLLIRRSLKEDHAPGTYAMVSGKVENVTNERDVLENAVKREVLEEVGIEVDVEKYVCSNCFTSDKGNTVVDIIFLCKHASGEAQPLDPDEVSAVEWMTKDEIENNTDIPPWVQNGFKAAFSAK